METKIFYDQDANGDLLRDKAIAIIGYGAQGAAHALNLRDSGCQVIVGQRPNGPGFDRAIEDGFAPTSIEEASTQADLINILLPDEVHGEVFDSQIASQLEPGNIVMTCHGFSFHYGLVNPPPGNDCLLVAPKGQGHMVRGEYVRGGGVPCLLAVGESASETTFQIGLAYAQALGGTKAGVIQTTIAAETETDLFGEQAVLCGGLSSLVSAGFETLVEAGYQPELAYFECLHELKIIIDLLHQGGLSRMRDAISTTAEFGDYQIGPKVIDQSVKARMREVLDNIQNGNFAREFVDQYQQGHPVLLAEREKTSSMLIEKVGQRLRAMMPWLNAS